MISLDDDDSAPGHYDSIARMGDAGPSRTKRRLTNAMWDSGAVSNIFNDSSFFDSIDKTKKKRFSNAAVTQAEGFGIATIYLLNTLTNKLVAQCLVCSQYQYQSPLDRLFSR